MPSTQIMTGTIVRTPAVTIERIDVPAGMRLRGHGHDVPHLCFLAHGAFEERDRGRSRTVDGGTLRSSPAGDEHDIRFRAPSQCLLVLIHGDPGDVAPRLPAERRFIVTARVRMLARELLAALSAPLDLSPLRVEMQALELLAASGMSARRRSRTPPDWLVRVRDRIRDAPLAPLTTADLAHDAGFHPVYVARAFRDYYGVGVGEFARLVRADRASEMLRASAEPLARIAAHAGYADQSHLSRDMRRLLGHTPAKLRRRRARVLQVSSVQEPRRNPA